MSTILLLVGVVGVVGVVPLEVPLALAAYHLFRRQAQNHLHCFLFRMLAVGTERLEPVQLLGLVGLAIRQHSHLMAVVQHQLLLVVVVPVVLLELLVRTAEVLQSAIHRTHTLVQPVVRLVGLVGLVLSVSRS